MCPFLKSPTKITPLLFILVGLLLFTSCKDADHFNTGDIVYLAEDGSDLYQLFSVNPADSNPTPKQLTQQSRSILDFHVNSQRFTAFTQEDDKDLSTDIWILWNNSEETIPLAVCGKGACNKPRWAPDQNLFAYEVRPIQNGELVAHKPQLFWYDLEAFQSIPIFQDENWIGQDPRFTADGKKMAYLVPNLDEIHIFDIPSGEIDTIPSRANLPVEWGTEDELYFSALRVNYDQTMVHILKTDKDGESLVDLTGAGIPVEDAGYQVSPNGKHLVFTRKAPRAGVGRQIWLMGTDGSDPRSLTDELSIQHGAVSWSPDGSKLLYQRFDLSKNNAKPEIWVLDLETNIARFIVHGTRPQWSP